MRRLLWTLVAAVVFVGCGGGDGGDESGTDVMVEDGVGADGVTTDVIDNSDGIPLDALADEGSPDTVVGPSAIALRLETRFGTTEEWKGVTSVSPTGFVHTETDTGTACEKLAESRYIDELMEVVAEFDPFSWDENYTGKEDGTCPSTTLLLVLHIESIGDGRSHTVRWCEDGMDLVPGGAELVKKVDKLKADAKANGECDVLPFLLGRPAPVATMGYDDGLANVLVVAKFRSPDYCLVLYSQYSPDIYQTTQVLGVDAEYIEEILGLYLPITEHSDHLQPLLDFCPGTSAVLMEASLASDVSPPIVGFVVAEVAEGTKAWMATQGVAAIQPAGPEGEPIIINVNGMEFHPIDGLMTSPSLDFGPWSFEWLESTAFEVENMGAPPAE